MTPLAAIIRLTEMAGESIRNEDDRLSYYQAAATAFFGVDKDRSEAAQEAARAMLAADAAQRKFREVLMHEDSEGAPQ